MYRSFSIKNFRGFRDFTLEPLERVNLIAGKNNVGKTALLEAIFLHLGPGNPELGLRVNLWRGIQQFSIEVEEIWGSLFHNLDTNCVIEMESKEDDDYERFLSISLLETGSIQLETSVENGKNHIQKGIGSLTTAANARELRLDYRDSTGQANTTRARIVEDNTKKDIKIERDRLVTSPSGAFITARTRFPQEDAERFSKLEAVGRGDEILFVLKLLEPRLKRLAVLVVSGVPVIHGDIGIGRLIPLPLTGEGMARLLSIVLGITKTEHGILLIDEVENGLHHTTMQNVWKAVAEVARRYDTQIFATTHSWECIRAAHEAFSESETYDFRLHRLDRIDDEIQAVTYDQESLDSALKTELEVR